MSALSTVTVSRVGSVGLIAINNPPVNAASHAVRAGLIDALNTHASDEAVECIALYGEGRSFVAGADIREFGKAPQAPWLPEVCLALEKSPKPVVSVLHGVALGGGLELAIATQYRIAVPRVTLGFPEVSLGILPGAGGTQRAPRLIRQKAALDLIVTGRRIGAEEALRLGLVDEVTEGAPRDLALATAQKLIHGEITPRVTGDIHMKADPEAIELARTSVMRSQGHLFSPLKCVEAVAAASKPIGEGLVEERRLFDACMQSPQRAGLIHAFFAERAVGKIPEAEAAAQDVSSVAVIGAGTMGRGIATSCLLSGLPVTVIEPNDTAREQAEMEIYAALDGAVQRGKLTAAKRGALICDLTDDLAKAGSADLIIEAVIEDMGVKENLFAELGRIAKPYAILASNTSYLDINQLARASGRPEQVLGLHFFSPAHIMKLLEVVVGADTAPSTVATGFALAKRMKKIAVRSGVCDGFIGNRIMTAYRKACDFMLLDGTPVQDIDAAMREFGFKMGPFEMSDLAGLDIGWAARKRLAPTRDRNARYHGHAADALCESGALGRKSGRGYYLHETQPTTPNPALAGIVSAQLKAEGRAPVHHSAEEIQARFMAAMIAEAVRVLEDGIALRPIDIDAVFLFGFGFPRWKGGPLHHADTLGAAHWVGAIERYSGEDPHFWRVPALLREIAETGRSITSFNGK